MAERISYACDCPECRDVIPSLNQSHYVPYYCQICGKETHGLALPGVLCWDCYFMTSYIFHVYVQGLVDGVLGDPGPRVLKGEEPIGPIKPSGYAENSAGSRNVSQGASQNDAGKFRSRPSEGTFGHPRHGADRHRDHRPAQGQRSARNAREFASPRDTTARPVERLGRLDRKPWSTGEVRRMVAEREAGESWDTVAARLGRSVPSCKSKQREIRRQRRML